MTTPIFTLPDFKPSYDEYFISIDLTDWLGDEQVSSVTFTATKKSDDSDATSDVLDTGVCTNTTVLVKPWIKGGEDGESYQVKMQVSADGGSKGEFYLEFSVKDY